jgi:methyl-accepting chemotaxis protein
MGSKTHRVCAMSDTPFEIEEKMRQIIEYAPCAICTFSKDMRITSSNPALEAITGISQDDLHLSNNNSQLIEKTRITVSNAFQTGDVQHATISVMTKKGERNFRETAIPIKNKDNEETSEVAVYYFDETSLVSQVRDYRKTIEYAEYGFFKTDPNFNFIKCNDIVLNLTGYTRENFLRMNLKDITILDSEGGKAIDVLKTKETLRILVTLQVPKGSIHGSLTLIPIINDGEITSINGQFIDKSRSKEKLTYLDEVIANAVTNLSNLAKGELDFKITEIPTNKYTKEIRSRTEALDVEMIATRDSLFLILSEIINFTELIADGKIKGTTINAENYHGIYLDIVKELIKLKSAIEKPLSEITRVSTLFKHCDFSTHINEDIEFRGEWKLVKFGLNSACEHVRESIGTVNKTVEQLNSISDNTIFAIEEVNEGRDFVANLINQLKMSIAGQKETVSHLTKTIQDVANTTADISIQTSKLASLATSADEIAKDGTKQAEDAESGMIAITRASEEVSRLILEIQGEMEHIGKIVNIITEIAGQTNLLALNAAIEAARAGDAGRGFAVVATEVKSLAEQSRNSAKIIQEMIETLTNKSKDAANAMNHSKEAVQDGTIALSRTLSLFTELAESVDEISNNVGVIASVTEEQTAATEEISSNAIDIDNLIKKDLDSIIATASAADEAEYKINILKVNAEQLRSLYEELSNDLKKLTI